jgi:hypothetical protein
MFPVTSVTTAAVLAGVWLERTAAAHLKDLPLQRRHLGGVVAPGCRTEVQETLLYCHACHSLLLLPLLLLLCYGQQLCR